MRQFRIVVLFCLLIMIQPLYGRILFSSITSPGFYQLSSNVSNQITISASNVTFDLGGYTISGGSNGIVIDAGLENVIIQNGRIDGVPNDAIQVNTGCHDIVLKNVTVRESTRGIYLNNVMDASVVNCEMTQNITGIELDSCSRANVTNCIASRNTQAGYSLVSTMTSLFTNCSALSTGLSNSNQFDNNVYGFVTSAGFSNIFDRCIANATQALSTTDANSIIAGFAFLNGESCSQIVDSKAGSAITNSLGATIPYGIYMEGILSLVLTQTATPAVIAPSSAALDGEWSPDDGYIAVATLSSPGIQIYSFNRTTNTALRFATPATIPSGGSNNLSWSFDTNYLASAENNAPYLSVYSFDTENNSLNRVATPATALSAAAQSVNWSSDGKYLAVGMSNADSQYVRIYFFDRVQNILTQVASPTSIPSATVNAVSWTSDDNYLAVATTNQVIIYSFNRGNNSLEPIATTTLGGTALSLSWSFDNNFLAVGDASDACGIYQFNATNGTLQLVATPNVAATAPVQSVHWSSDGKYLVIGQATIGVYSFDRSNFTLTQQAIPNYPPGSTNSARFSHDGSYISVSGTASPYLRLYTAITFSSGAIIQRNTVSCNNGSIYQTGFGISGSSVQNLVNNNISYGNQKGFAFIPNVVSGNSNTVALPGQNIEYIDSVITTPPPDINLLLQQIMNTTQNNITFVTDIQATLSEILSVVIGLPSQIGILQQLESSNDSFILSRLAVLESKIDTEDCCSVISAMNSKIDEISSQLGVVEYKIDNLDLGQQLSELDIILSKVDIVGSTLDVFISQIDAFDLGIELSLLDVIDDKLQLIDSQVDVVSSKIDNFDLNLLESNIEEIVSQLDVVENKINTLATASQLSVVESKIDADDCCSVINAIDSKIDLIGSDISRFDVIESKIDIINSKEDVISGQIAALQQFDSINDALILSQLGLLESSVDGIGSQLNIIESKIDSDDCCSTINVINSKIDLIGSDVSRLVVIESKIDVANSNIDVTESYAEANNSLLNLLENQVTIVGSKIDGIGSQLDIVESKIDLDSCCSTINVINSKIDALQASDSVSDSLIISYLATLESKADGIGSQLNVIESTVEEVSSDVDIILEQVVINIPSQQAVIESKIDRLSACGALALTTDSIISSSIILDIPGAYCVSEDLVADIFITVSCVTVDLNDHCIVGFIDIATSDDALIKNGKVLPPAPVATPVAGITVEATAVYTQLRNVIVRCTNTTANDVAGRTGIAVYGPETQIENCTIIAGAAGNSTTTNAPNGGDGIYLGLGGSDGLIRSCNIISANGGSTINAASNGGNGGHGIHIANNANSEIFNTIILATGAGGDGGSSGTGGNGGSGFYIEATSNDASVRNCTIKNTGAGGTGGGATGAGGQAITDLVTIVNNYSMLYSNFAHNIANSIKYSVQGSPLEYGIPSPNPPTATVINPLANVYVS